MSQPQNFPDFAATARLNKAKKLAAKIRECGGSAERTRTMTADEWDMAAAAAKCNPPHSQATVDLVVALLEDYEHGRPAEDVPDDIPF